jgi:hypothetical protein
MTYTPNFNDPRTISRCKRAIGFVCGVMSTSSGHAWSSRYIDKYLGISSNPLSKYLRENLLIVTDDYYRYNSGKLNMCKKYQLNQKGLESLREMLKTSNIQLYPSVLQVAKEDHLAELNSGNFEYNDKSNRLWHPLQRYRKQYRTQILHDHGYQHQYDISTCAPTLIHQYSQMVPEIINARGKWQQGPMDLYLFALHRYLNDKEQVRKQVAEGIDLPIQAVKEIINALFAGAVISKNKDSDIYHILNGDLARIQWLKQDPYIQELVSDIKTCWEYLRPIMPLRTKKTSKGSERRLAVTAKQKWHMYFELERRVVNSIRCYLEERDIKHFLIHDGWCCSSEINREELGQYVRDQTGFNLKFDYVKTSNIQLYPSVLQVTESTIVC